MEPLYKFIKATKDNLPEDGKEVFVRIVDFDKEIYISTAYVEKGKWFWACNDDEILKKFAEQIEFLQPVTKRRR